MNTIFLRGIRSFTFLSTLYSCMNSCSIAYLRCDLRRGGISRVRKSPFTEEERRTRALDYLHEHSFLRIQDYMAITGLKRSSANRELLRLSSDPASGITISGYGSHRMYVRRKTESDR